MHQVSDPRLSAANDGNRARDVAQRPQYEPELKHCPNAGVVTEAKGQVVVAAWPEQGERAFQMLSRVAILSGEPMGRSC